MDQEIVKTHKQDSFTIGTPAKGGSIKIYLDMDEDLSVNQERLEKGLKIVAWLKLQGYMQ